MSALAGGRLYLREAARPPCRRRFSLQDGQWFLCRIGNHAQMKLSDLRALRGRDGASRPAMEADKSRVTIIELGGSLAQQSSSFSALSVARGCSSSIAIDAGSEKLGMN